MLTLPRGSAHEIVLFAKQKHENRGRVPRFSCFLKLCVRNLSHMPQIDDQQRSAGEHPRGSVNVHQHLERGRETENRCHPDESENDRAEHSEDGRLERLAHAAERRAFDLVGGGETSSEQTCRMRLMANAATALLVVNADKKSSQIMNTALRISVNTTPNSMQYRKIFCSD